MQLLWVMLFDSQGLSDINDSSVFVLSLGSPAESKASRCSIDPLNVSSYSITSHSLSPSRAPWLPNSVHLHSFPRLAEIVCSSCGALGCNQITATEMEWTTNYPAVYVCSFWANVLTEIQNPWWISDCSNLGFDFENSIY